MEMERLLPGYNCGECGKRNCREFAGFLTGMEELDMCPFMKQERFLESRARIEALLKEKASRVEERIVGVIDGLQADFSLGPLKGEQGCREDLYPFDHTHDFLTGDLIRYRPLGCPITHFARVLKYDHGILTVHIIGPIHLLGEGEETVYKDLGICMVAAFEGTVERGRVPEVGQTVRFIPGHCMMQKVHSGVVVHSEGGMVRVEGVDLKVW
ncbi:MAG: hypothetical protein GKC10_01040 [Methanosarcinales archaeon]|nr:hypothetical protein [Methanosarcinales archaeon]